MLIDWFTVGAQALNFVVLVWLLKRFLYQPVLDAIDAREARIAKQVADARATQLDAQAQRDVFQQKNDSFDRERAQLLVQASSAADAERTRRIAAAGKAADDLSARRHEALKVEAQQFNRDVALHVQREVFAVSRKALTELASTSLQERIAEVFMDRLRALDASARTELATALQSSAPDAVIRTAFELPAAQRVSIQAVLDSLAPSSTVRFETAEELVSGIELVVGGQKFSWSIAHYLDSLEHVVAGLLVPPADGVQAVPTTGRMASSGAVA